MILQFESSTVQIEHESAKSVTASWSFEINLFCNLKVLLSLETVSLIVDIAFTFVHTELEDRMGLSWKVKLWLCEAKGWLRRRLLKYNSFANHLIVGRLKRKNIFQGSFIWTL